MYLMLYPLFGSPFIILEQFVHSSQDHIENNSVGPVSWWPHSVQTSFSNNTVTMFHVQNFHTQTYTRKNTPTLQLICIYLTIWRLTTTIWIIPHSQPPDVAFYIFIQQIYILNILNMLHNLRFFSLQNAVYLIMLPFLVPILLTF